MTGNPKIWLIKLQSWQNIVWWLAVIFSPAEYGFHIIQFKLRVWIKEICLEQGIKFSNNYRMFHTGCNNSSWKRIGLTEFLCM